MAEVLKGGLVEFFADEARSAGNPNSNGAHLDRLKEHGVINNSQWAILLQTEPRRCAFEINLIYKKILEEGLTVMDDDTFIEIENAGAKYYFENFSPLARFNFN